MCQGLVILAFAILLTTSRLFRWLVFSVIVLFVVAALNVKDEASSATIVPPTAVVPFASIRDGVLKEREEPFTKPCESNNKLSCLNLQPFDPFRSDIHKACSGLITKLDNYWYGVGPDCPFFISDDSGRKILASCRLGRYCVVNALMRRNRETQYIEYVYSAHS